jgi:hypothetical protein
MTRELSVEERAVMSAAGDAAWSRLDGVRDTDAPVFYEGVEAGYRAALNEYAKQTSSCAAREDARGTHRAVLREPFHYKCACGGSWNYDADLELHLRHAREVEELPADGRRSREWILRNNCAREVQEADGPIIEPGDSVLVQEVVRDTEREHEIAEDIDDAIHIAVDDGRQTLCGQDARPRNSVGPSDPRPHPVPGCWMCLQIADEVAGDAHAGVLAKALDQFSRNIPPHYWPRPVYELLQAVEPTLRALGYPKEKTP